MRNLNIVKKLTKSTGSSVSWTKVSHHKFFHLRHVAFMSHPSLAYTAWHYSECEEKVTKGDNASKILERRLYWTYIHMNLFLHLHTYICARPLSYTLYILIQCSRNSKLLTAFFFLKKVVLNKYHELTTYSMKETLSRQNWVAMFLAQNPLLCY
jgi:hypothetical protein